MLGAYSSFPNRAPSEQLWLAFVDQEAMFREAVLESGDPVALRSLADSLDDVEYAELGGGD